VRADHATSVANSSSCVALPFWEVVIAKIVDRVYSKKKAPRNVLAEVHRRDFLEPLRSFFWSATLEDVVEKSRPVFA